jgi:hypothetical protein
MCAKYASLLAPDGRSILKWHLAGAEPQEQFFIVGATDMKVFSRLLYRFVRPPGSRGKEAPKAPADAPPLVRRELTSLIA